MKVSHLIAAIALTAAASAASAQQMISIGQGNQPQSSVSTYSNPAAAVPIFHITVSSNQPVVVGPLFPPQPPNGVNYPTQGFSYTSMANKRQPDMKMSNQHYSLDCFEKTKGVCDKVADALKKADIK